MVKEKKAITNPDDGEVELPSLNLESQFEELLDYPELKELRILKCDIDCGERWWIHSHTYNEKIKL